MNNLCKKWRALWQPNIYHSWDKSRRYFEGWDVKIVDLTEQFVLTIVPGISMDAQGEQYAFIQVLDGKQCIALIIDARQVNSNPRANVLP